MTGNGKPAPAHKRKQNQVCKNFTEGWKGKRFDYCAGTIPLYNFPHLTPTPMKLSTFFLLGVFHWLTYPA